jgi:hypothetical protein
MLHKRHTVLPGRSLLKLPAAHSRHAAGLEAFGVELKYPSPHFMHTLDEVAFGVVL